MILVKDRKGQTIKLSEDLTELNAIDAELEYVMQKILTCSKMDPEKRISATLSAHMELQLLTTARAELYEAYLRLNPSKQYSGMRWPAPEDYGKVVG
jgi:hypothetical protein